MSYFWIISGRILAGVKDCFLLAEPGEGYRIISALILAWSLSMAWTQLVAFGEGKMGRIIGLIALVIVGVVYFVIHHYFNAWLQNIAISNSHPSLFIIILVAVILVLGSIISTWVAKHQSSKFSLLYIYG